MTARAAAFFDLDRTVLRIDSGMSYMRFQRMRREISSLDFARAAWWSLQYRLARLDVEELAQRLVVDYRDELDSDMRAKCQVWYKAYVEHEIAPRAREAVERHRDSGDCLVLLTSATQYIADVVADALGIEHRLCTRVEVCDGRLTGRLDQICFGPHKVTIAERFAREHEVDIDASWFYSDSYNDMPMLCRVGCPVAVNPDLRLRLHARGAGWPIERWAW